MAWDRVWTCSQSVCSLSTHLSCSAANRSMASAAQIPRRSGRISPGQSWANATTPHWGRSSAAATARLVPKGSSSSTSRHPGGAPPSGLSSRRFMADRQGSSSTCHDDGRGGQGQTNLTVFQGGRSAGKLGSAAPAPSGRDASTALAACSGSGGAATGGAVLSGSLAVQCHQANPAAPTTATGSSHPTPSRTDTAKACCVRPHCARDRRAT